MKLMAIDGNSIINRSFYGIRPLSTRDGLYTHAVFGFLTTLLRLREMQVGFSAGTFAIEPKTGRVTATQVISEDRTTYNTIKAIQDRGLTTGLTDVLYWFDVYAGLYHLAPAGSFAPAVSFGDSIFEDTGVEFERRLSLAQAGYLRPELVNAWYFGVDEKKARQMMPATSPDVLTFGNR